MPSLPVHLERKSACSKMYNGYHPLYGTKAGKPLEFVEKSFHGHFELQLKERTFVRRQLGRWTRGNVEEYPYADIAGAKFRYRFTLGNKYMALSLLLFYSLFVVWSVADHFDVGNLLLNVLWALVFVAVFCLVGRRFGYDRAVFKGRQILSLSYYGPDSSEFASVISYIEERLEAEKESAETGAEKGSGVIDSPE